MVAQPTSSLIPWYAGKKPRLNQFFKLLGKPSFQDAKLLECLSNLRKSEGLCGLLACLVNRSDIIKRSGEWTGLSMSL
jgi:hypothetical protein